MGRNARIGLFLLMGLIVALARLIEVEVTKARPAEEPATALLVPKPPTRPPAPVHHRKVHHAAKPAAAPAPPAAQAPHPAVSCPSDPEGLEWPRGPVYTVKRGETLGVIAQKVLGTSRLAHKLLEANHSRIANPNNMKPGTRLLVPSREGARRD